MEEEEEVEERGQGVLEAIAQGTAVISFYSGLRAAVIGRHGGEDMQDPRPG